METPDSGSPVGLFSVLTNIFSSPSEVYEKTASREPSTSLWLIPFLVALLIGSGIAFMVTTNPTFKGQILDAQSKVMQKRVDQGKMTQAQMEAGQEQMEKMGGLFAVFGVIGVVVVLSLVYFGGALLLWLGAKVSLKSPAGYAKHLEIYGISSWIGVLGGIVAALMMNALGSMYATPSAALAVYSSYDPMNSLHRFLASVEIFGIWQWAVAGIGLSKTSGKSTGMGIATGLGVYVVIILIRLGWGLIFS